MIQQQEGFIGSKLKLIPHSQFVYSRDNQLLLLAKRQIIRLDTLLQTLVYSNIQDQKIIHATFHSIIQVYFLLTQNYILAVNRQGQLIKKIANDVLFGSKFVFVIAMKDGYKGVPNYRQDFILYVKGDNLYMSKLNIFNQRQMIKNKGICDVSFNFQKSQVVQSPQYIQNQKYLPQLSLLILWNTNETFIYQTPNNWGQSLQRLYIYNKVSKRQNLSLDYAVSMPNKVMAVAFQSGVVKIFHLDQSKKYLLDLKGHQAACSSIYIPYSNPNFLYSSGLDSTVRIWNLRDYEQVYMLQLDLLTKEIIFINETLLFVNTDQLKSKSYLCQLNTNLLDPIVNDNTSGHLVRMRCDKNWCVSIYSNNLIEFLSTANHQQNLKNQKLQYPLQYGQIVDVFKIDNDCYAVALTKGFSLIKFNKQQIKGQNFELKKLVYNQSIVRRKQNNDNFIQLIHQKLLGTYLFNVVSDWKNIPTAIKVTCIYFHKNTWLPLWDNSTQQKCKPKDNPVTYCVIGTSKGQILFVDIAQRSHYSTKVHFHIDSITFTRQIVINSSNQTKYFISISSDKQISIWQLSHNSPPSTLLTITYNRDITYIEVYSNYLLIGQKQGQFSIIKILIQNGCVKMMKANSIGGHLRGIICGDYIHYKQNDLFISGGQDSVIKIWRGVEKELIFQLKLFGIVTTVNFIHDRLNLIVCHNEQISFIRQDKLKSLTKADLLLDKKAEGQNFAEEINIRHFFMKQVSSPVSPLSPMRRGLRRMQTKNMHFFKTTSKIEDLQFVLTRQQKQQTQLITLPKGPVSATRLQSMEKKKIKRFHLYTNQQINSSLVLPRINTKQSIIGKIMPKQQKQSDILSDWQKNKNKLLSNAGKTKL